MLHFSASLFCAYCPHVSIPIYGVNRLFPFFVTFAPVFSQSRPYLVTIATRAKQPLFFTTRHHGLQNGIQHLSADAWKRCVKRSPNIDRSCNFMQV